MEHDSKKIKELKLALDANPNDTNLLYKMGRTLESAGKLELAILYFEKLLKLEPDDHESIHAAGSLLAKMGNFEEAVIQYRRAIELWEDAPDFYVDLGDSLRELNRLDEAEDAYLRALDFCLMGEEASHRAQVALSELEATPKSKSIVLSCKEDSLLPIDERVIREFLESPYFEYTFDLNYLEALPKIHGGVPTHPYFTLPSGAVRQIAWFVSYLDEKSSLPGPFQKAGYYYENDERVDDRSIPALVNDDLSVYNFDCRLLPFAALITNGSEPDSLRFYNEGFEPYDALCFDQSTNPQAIVLCDGKIAAKELGKYIWNKVDEYDFSLFLTPVADSFADFVEMLRAEP